MISYVVVLITVSWLSLTALSLSFTRKPEDPLIVVLNSNSSNVDFRWDFSLANGETLQYSYFRRHEKDKHVVLSRVTLGGTFTTTPNATLYSMDTNISPGPSSGYIRFTIKDIMKQKDNKDGSEANPLSIDYVYSLWIKTSISDDEIISYVEMKVLVRPTITMYGCQGCVNGSVIENQTITLFCNATGKPMPNIRWTKNGKPYNASSPGNTLIIPQVTRDDKGNYTCIADNGIGIQDNRTIPILVKYKPDVPSLSPPVMDACENKSIIVNCMVDAYPPVTNYSLYNGNNYLGSNSNGQFSITATPPGKNTLCCVASNEIGNSQCGHADVYVLGVIITPVCRINNETTSSATVNEGDEVVLQCDISGIESYYSYRWLEVKDSMARNISSAIQLRFDSINRTNEAQYQVILTDKLNCSASQLRSFNITVNYEPENTMFSSDKKVFCEGNSTQVNCTADGKPDPVYSLYRNNEYLSGNENGVFLVTFAEKGNYKYTCVPNNTAGVGPNKSQNVTVKGPLNSEMCTFNNKTNVTQTSVKELSLVDLRLTSSELDRLDFTWKNGTEIMAGLHSHNLTFGSITRHEGGTYRVVARDRFNCSANVECIFTVDVHYPPDQPIISSSVNKPTVDEGETVNLTCKAEANPKPYYLWIFKGKMLHGESNDTISISNITPNDAGDYTCIAVNYLGNTTSKTNFMVEYFNEPSCEAVPSTVKEGHNIILTCSVAAYPPANYTWNIGDRIENTPTMILTASPELDKKTFTCTVKNYRQSKNCTTAPLEVLYAPNQPTISSSANKPTVIEGETVNLTCKAEANPKPYYLWIFMGKMLHGESNDTISLSNITSNDAGDYTCIAINYLGNTTSKTNFMVEYFNEPSCEAVPPTVKEGDTITLNCSVAAYPPANYTWNVGMEHTATVILTASPELDKKTFTCTVKNYRQSKNCTTAPLEVLYQPRHVRILEQGVVVNASGVFNLTCITSSNPASNYTWSFNGRSIEGANSRVLVKQNISKYDAGKYQCTVSNAFGTAYNVTDVKVQYPPELKCKDKVFVIEDQKSSFFCNTSAYPDPDYTISYNRTNYPSSSLSITLSRSDNGSVITCIASNVLDSVQCTTVLIVTYPPDQPSILLSPDKTNVNEGETVDLTCKAEANPKPYYVWIFKGEVLQGRVNDTISISNITSNDAGRYTCNAVNDLGKSTAVTSLTVEYFREPSCEAIPAMVKIEDKITLNCSVAAYPPANYTWNIEDRIENTSTVILTASPELHDKTFTCTAANYRQSKNCMTAPLEVLCEYLLCVRSSVMLSRL